MPVSNSLPISKYLTGKELLVPRGRGGGARTVVDSYFGNGEGQLLSTTPAPQYISYL